MLRKHSVLEPDTALQYSVLSFEKLTKIFGIKFGNLPGYIQCLTSTALCVSTHPHLPPIPSFGSEGRGKKQQQKKQLQERKCIEKNEKRKEKENSSTAAVKSWRHNSSLASKLLKKSF